ncbi:MAG: ABC transporter permease [Dehalococcoidia bacterium]|nr:ABC transporter permease [Dehalococcoidia bacterium]
MSNYVLRRLVLIPATLLVASLVLFWLLFSQPGNAAILRVGSLGSCDECVKNLEQRLGLDDPFLVQYAHWLGHAVQGDFGQSLQNGQDIRPRIRRALLPTVELAILTTLLSAVIGSAVGIISAVRPNSVVDYFLRFVSILGLSIPQFWLATLIVVLPQVWWGWTPLRRDYVDVTDNPMENLRLMIWPALALAAGSSAYVARIVRSSMLEALSSDYVRTARAKGLRERIVVLRHVFRPSLITAFTVIGLQFGFILGGSVIMESIFGIPGLGQLLLSGVIFQDYPVVLAVTMVFGAGFLLISLFVDVMYAYLDPRLRRQA